VKDPKSLLIKNVFSNWAGMGVGLLVAFFMSPFLVHNLGTSEYGVWALIFSIVSYTNLLDIGMKQSLARYISKCYATKDYDGLNEVLNSSTFVYSIISAIVIFVVLVLAIFALGIFNIEPELLPYMRLAFIIVGMDNALIMFSMPFSAIGPFHRYDIYNMIDVPVSIVSAAAMAFFVMNGYGIVTMAVITISATAVRTTLRRYFQQRLVPQIRCHIKYVNKNRIWEMFGYGIISFFIVVSWMVIYQTDTIVIGIFISTSAVTYYNIAGTLISHLRGLISAIGIPLVPAVSHYDSTSDFGQIKSLHTKLNRYLFYLCASISASLFIFGDDFITLWMGPDFTQTIMVLYILVIPASLYLPQSTASSIMLGISKHRPLFYVLIAEATGNLILSLALVKPLGIYGVALGTAIAQLIIYSYIFPKVFSKIIGENMSSFYKNSLYSIFRSIIFTVPVGLLLDKYLPIFGWTGLIVKLIMVWIIVICGLYWTILYNDDRDTLKRRVQHLIFRTGQ